ncbi:hypothetical protein DB42_BK00200 [Neochlamydia sp. EPS4]|uniref:hypothetical protein n=1 Tax=Neochlamydia sp. EPS4 TaxID=1478175 RepID=UPI0005835B3F|nr:hypothetical protein [Neochlamydia sp. EPS4]KIC74205.1 hypothetical protein DB42_BK00200 [Neochlamydia sp. EPS4]
MKGPVARDSIGRCTPGNDLYAMIRNPMAKVASVAKPVDTIRSSRLRLEREATAKIGKFMQNFLVVARAGKYIFLAFTLPPYLLLYGLPKWVVENTVPLLFHLSLKPFQMMHHKLRHALKSHEASKNVIHSIKNLFSHAFKHTAEYIQWIQRTSQALFVHLKHSMVALGYRLLQPYLPIMQRSIQTAEAVTKMLLQKTYQRGDKQAELAREFALLMWKIAKEEFAGPLNLYINDLKAKFNTFKKHLKKQVEKPRLEIQKFNDNLIHQLKRINETLHTLGLKISKHAEIMTLTVVNAALPFIGWAKPQIQRSVNLFQTGRAKLNHHLTHLSSIMQSLTLSALKASRFSQHLIVNSVKDVFKVIVPRFVKQFFNPEGGFKQKRQQMLEFFLGKVKKIPGFAKQLLSNALEASKKGLFKFLQKFYKFIFLIGKQLKELPMRLAKAIFRSYLFARNSFVQINHLMRWFFILSYVLVRLAWQELREIAGRILESYSFKKN